MLPFCVSTLQLARKFLLLFHIDADPSVSKLQLARKISKDFLERAKRRGFDACVGDGRVLTRFVVAERHQDDCAEYHTTCNLCMRP